MTLGRFRDVPDEMDDVECTVAAAQYPEGGLVAGLGVGIAVALLVAPGLVAVAPFVGGLAGFAAGRWLRARRVRALRGDDTEEPVDPGEPGERFATDGRG